MTPKSFFTIVIKLIGIFFITKAIISTSYVLNVALQIMSMSSTGGSVGLITGWGSFLILVVSSTFLVIWLCIFRTEWIIDQLKLDRGFAEEKFELTIHRSVILRIAIIIMGGLIVVESLPALCQEVLFYFQSINIYNHSAENPESKYMIRDFVSLFLGLLMLTSSRLITNFIELKRKA